MSTASSLLSPSRITARARRRVMFGARDAGAARDARAARAERRSLQRELAAYTSENDLAEIGAILDRHGDALADGIRSLLGA